MRSLVVLLSCELCGINKNERQYLFLKMSGSCFGYRWLAATWQPDSSPRFGPAKNEGLLRPPSDRTESLKSAVRRIHFTLIDYNLLKTCIAAVIMLTKVSVAALMAFAMCMLAGKSDRAHWSSAANESLPRPSECLFEGIMAYKNHHSHPYIDLRLFSL